MVQQEQKKTFLTKSATTEIINQDDIVSAINILNKWMRGNQN